MGLTLGATGKLMLRNGKLFTDENGYECCCGSDCPCADTIPDTITATFEIIGVDGVGCECIDGATITLTRETGESICATLGQGPGYPRWSGSVTICNQVVCLCFIVCEARPDGCATDNTTMHLMMSVSALDCNVALQDVTVDCNTNTCDPVFAEFTYTNAMLQALCFDITDNRELKVTITP